MMATTIEHRMILRNVAHTPVEMIFTRIDSVLETDLTTEMVAIDGNSGTAYRLNESARAIWQRLPAARADLVTMLMQRFEIDSARAAGDVDLALQTLVAAGLVEQRA